MLFCLIHKLSLNFPPNKFDAINVFPIPAPYIYCYKNLLLLLVFYIYHFTFYKRFTYYYPNK